MNIIKLSAIDSTNSYLKRLVKEGIAQEGQIISTDNQTQGRGQQGASWQFQKGKSLAFSILKQFDGLPVKNQFSLAMATSMGVQKALQKLSVPDVKIKWPNDILSDQKKLCGILIENSVQGSTIKDVIVGIGLNVNETHFTDLPNASSMKLSTGHHYNRDQVLQELAKTVLNELAALETLDKAVLKDLYEAQLFRRNEVSTFKNVAGTVFKGTLLGVTAYGQLRIKTADNRTAHYGLKEVSLVY